jgi:hypothetical protein
MFKVQVEDSAHARRFGGVDVEPSTTGINVIAQHWVPADPLSLLPCN